MPSKRIFVIQAIIVFLLLGALAFHYTKLEHQSQQMEAMFHNIEQQVAQYEKALGSVIKYKELEEILVRRLKITDLITRHPNPVVFMALKERDPSQIWLTEWKAEPGKVYLKGQAVGQDELKSLLSGLCSPQLRRVEPRPDGEPVNFEVEMPDECDRSGE